jgi:hypothetical protein
MHQEMMSQSNQEHMMIVLATYSIRRFFGIFGRIFHQAIPLFRPEWARLFLALWELP